MSQQTHAQHPLSTLDKGTLVNLENWITERFVAGNRNNQMSKYAHTLMDSGMTLNEIEAQVTSFNSSLENGLSQDEIDNTIMPPIARKLIKI
jgi:hypothetical protein